MPGSTASRGAIYSTFAADPDFGELVELYVQEMPGRIAVLEAAFANGDMDDLSLKAHQLKGAAGSYGFGQLTPIAAAVERAARNREPVQEIKKTLQELIDACRQVRAGAPGAGGKARA
jgi:HPt (histidine-containing phosphotransfer) domain-containing protein